MSKRERNDEEYSEEVREFVGLFENMPDEVVAEMIMSRHLNIVQIYNACKALGKERAICDRYDIWNRLFQRAHGKELLNKLKNDEHLRDPIKRLATYEIFQSAAYLDFKHRRHPNILCSLEREVNGDVHLRFYEMLGDEFFHETPHSMAYEQDIYRNVAHRHGIKVNDDVLIKEDFIFIFGDTKEFTLETDVFMRACIYALLSQGWYPVHHVTHAPIWPQACINSNECLARKAAFKCAGCLKVSYCGVECASKHWAQHQSICERISRRKARQILHDGNIRGHPLTDKQRRYFGYLSNN